MTRREREVLQAEDPRERRRLVSVAVRILGTVAEAEDAVQETYIRWYRLSQGERDAIEKPHAWLARVTSRICLNLLTSARQRHELSVGPWLPEPVPTSSFPASTLLAESPLEHVTLDESVSTALLLVLESMTPAERVVFVLHDVFAIPFDEIADSWSHHRARSEGRTKLRRRRRGDGRRNSVVGRKRSPSGTERRAMTRWAVL